MNIFDNVNLICDQRCNENAVVGYFNFTAREQTKHQLLEGDNTELQ